MQLHITSIYHKWDIFILSVVTAGQSIIHHINGTNVQNDVSISVLDEKPFNNFNTW